MLSLVTLVLVAPLRFEASALLLMLSEAEAAEGNGSAKGDRQDQAGSEQQPVGQAQASQSHLPDVASVLEQPGVLTPRRKFVLEPSLHYSYSSSNRVTLLGYTVIPALTIGLINVQEVKSNTLTGVLTARYGLTNRWEVEAKFPYVYRYENTVALPFNTGTSTSVPILNGAHGKHIGDIECATRYQFNDGGSSGFYFIGSLRFKSRTGKDPFAVETLTQSTGFNGAGLQRELPTGSGFYSLQPGISVLLPSDPLVLFGSVSYLYNFARHNVRQNTDAGKVDLGKVSAGGIITANVGMGLALNNRASVTLGYEHDSVGKTSIQSDQPNVSTRLELGTAILGFSYRSTDALTLSFGVGVGVTRDTPDVTLTFRMPVVL